MMALDLSQNKHADVSMDEKDRLFDEVKSDEDGIMYCMAVMSVVYV